MRLVLGNESVSAAVERSLEALLIWPAQAPLLQLKAGWQEQQVYVWGSTEQGAAVSLIHSILLRANRDELRPNLHLQPVPSLHVSWVPVAEIESGQRSIDPDVLPGVLNAVYTLRSHVQRDPGLLLHYLADMSVQDVAARLGVAEGTVKARLSRGRSALGAVFAFAAGLAALRWLSSWLETGKWYLFGIYCVAASVGVFVLHMKGF